MHHCRGFSLAAAGFLAALALVPATGAAAESPPAEKVPLLLDTDIGSDVDDAFALALALASPELDLQGVTTVAADAETRALVVCRLLTAVGSRDVPVAWGPDPQPLSALDCHIQDPPHPAVSF